MKKNSYYILSERWKTGFLETAKETRIRWGIYCPNQKVDPSKFVVLLTGRAEFIEKYNYLAEDLDLPDDTGLLIWDHRGQGKSSGKPSHISSYDQYCMDCQQLLQTLVKDKPYVMIAHSMGTLIAIYGLIFEYFNPEKLFLSSPFFGFSQQKLYLSMIKTLSLFMTKIGFGTLYWKKKYVFKTFDENPLTSCPKQYERITQSLFVPMVPTYSWIYASFQALSAVNQKTSFQGLKTPLATLITKQDKIVNREDSLNWITKAHQYSSITKITTSFLEGRHEPFSEKKEIYEQALQRIKEWLHE